MAGVRLSWLLLLSLLLAGCMPGRQEVRRALDAAAERQSQAIECEREDRCAIQSPLRELARSALRDSTPDAPQHEVLLLDSGADALLARIHLIRSARHSIEMQTFIFVEDDIGFFTLNELLQAARRGVKVRIILDQLFSVDDVKLLARLAQAHVNFELRLYNPTFGQASTEPVEFLAGVMCCFFRFNQRMHNKLLLVDGEVGITGGRNYQDRYFDWDTAFNYRDRDILVAGPVARLMGESFEEFWRHRKTVPVAALRDVRPWIGDGAARMGEQPAVRVGHVSQINAVVAEAEDPEVIRQRLVARSHRVGRVDYISDVPNKRFERDYPARRDLTRRLQKLLAGAEKRIVLQTPYLVFSSGAQDVFRKLQAKPAPPSVVVSTNSLASTDAFYVYALSHKYKRRYLRELGFRIHEYKPYPGSAPIRVQWPDGAGSATRTPDATEARPAFGSASAGSGGDLRGPLPLEQSRGVRVGLHAKSLVIDDRIAMVGTHNFDPRSDSLNTENAVIVYDAGFARELEQLILHDTAPENAWTIARRARPPLLSGVNYSLGKVSEALPLFDFWPFRYATSYEMRPGCSPLPPEDPEFDECYEPVGDFPEVGLPLKAIYTRVLTAFGAGLAPIL